jgi:allantoinase
MADLAIHCQRTLIPDGIRDAFVIITDGRITEVASSLRHGDIPLLEMEGKVLMPGLIDPHVHINEPGRTNWEGFDTATKAAIAGGITCLVDMPLNSSPVTTTTAAFDEKKNAAKNLGHLHTHCGFWGGVIPGNEQEIQPLINKGVLGFKAFLTHSGIDEFPNVTESDLRKVMPVIARHGLPLLVHCELPGKNPVPITDNRSYSQYMQSRPRSWEDDAISLMIRLCEEFGCRVHIVHLSSADSIPQLEAAKQKGLPITVETAQHYLFFDADNIQDGQTLFKCAPPIREKSNNERLWQGLRDGIIDFVATDHSPSPPEYKCLDSGDFTRAWGGISGLQLALPVLWTAMRSHNGNILQIIKWLCENPALLAGVNNSKGKIQVGYDADLVVWDPEKSFIVKAEMLEHRHKASPYLGNELFGVIEQTFLKGKKVYDNGNFVHLDQGTFISR